MDNVRCSGSEKRLLDCPHINNSPGWDCSHTEDAAVFCQTSICTNIQSLHKTMLKHTILALQCQEGALRLTGESSTNQGRVEICVNEIWGTICATNWGQRDATVACRQLGFPVVYGIDIKRTQLYLI